MWIKSRSWLRGKFVHFPRSQVLSNTFFENLQIFTDGGRGMERVAVAAGMAHLLRRGVVHDAGADGCDLVPVLEENVDAREASSKDRAQPSLFFLLFDFFGGDSTAPRAWRPRAALDGRRLKYA